MKMNLLKYGTIHDEIKLMKTIELVYPDIFSWRFDGTNIECLAIIPMKKENMGIMTRYGGYYGFIRLLRDRLLEILKYRGDVVILSKQIDNMIISTGSINYNTNMWAVDIQPNTKIEKILMYSASRIIKESVPKELDMKYWVRELNPDFYREAAPPMVTRNKYEVTPETMNQYPPCIKEIGNLKKKGNYARFLLGSFLLGIHNERDAKHQLDLMLTDKEREHVNTGNCKDQWRAILTKKYAIPSCKTMQEHGFCPGKCSKFGMIWNLDKEVKNEQIK
jgi:hypothetical protein